MSRFPALVTACLMALLAGLACQASALTAPERGEDIFSQAHQVALVMEMEAAIAEAQAAHGVIPASAAREIRATARPETVPLEELDAEYDRVRHRMVALLNVWRRSLSDEADDALHLGVTTVDIYDTVMILQLKQSIALMRTDLLKLEDALIDLAMTHRDTPTVGRTLGQHALPITFGKKVAVWTGANRRSIERLNDVECRLNELGVLRGAVGTHLGLGDKGREIERDVAQRLGLGPVTPADWHGLRDVFGEYASVLAIMARTHAKMGEEIFRLQMTDIGEVYEARPGSAVSSSSMPHKRNPSRSEALIHAGRVIPATADILLADIANEFERDNTSRSNRTLEELSLAAFDMISDAQRLIDRLVIDEARMYQNLMATDGLILSQRLVLAVQDAIGKEEAERRVSAAAVRSVENAIPFRRALLEDEVLRRHLADDLDALLDPTTYVGLSAEQVDDTATWLRQRPATRACTT